MNPLRGLSSPISPDRAKAAGEIDGTAGTLRYSGYTIDDLATSVTFEEVFYLLLYGELPRTEQLATLRAELATAQADGAALALLHGLPADGAPIDALRTAVSALAQRDPRAEDTSLQNARRVGIRLAGLMPVALASAERRVHGLEPVAPRPELGHAANILYMLWGTPCSATAARALNTYLVLLAEHGLNASTFAARVATSAGADAYAALTAAVATLKLTGGQGVCAHQETSRGDQDRCHHSGPHHHRRAGRLARRLSSSNRSQPTPSCLATRAASSTAALRTPSRRWNRRPTIGSCESQSAAARSAGTQACRRVAMPS